MVALLKALGLTKEDLKGLSRAGSPGEDSQSQAETVVAELKAKQSSGTLTEEQQKRLDIVQKYLAHSHKKAQTSSN